MIGSSSAGFDGTVHDICIVGSGPVGITTALELARRGRRVLLLESGGAKPAPATQDLSHALIVDPAVHDDMTVAVSRQLGGTSNLWGARCQPYDPIDFTPRPELLDATWPITLGELAPFYEKACVYANCGAPVFSEALPPAAKGDDRVDIERMERFSNKPAFQIAHEAELAASKLIDVRLNSTVTDIAFGEGGQAQSLTVADAQGGRHKVLVGSVILAMGGLETTRFLLSLQRSQPDRFGGPQGALGRYYMGHLAGEVADITLANDAIDKALDFQIDSHGSYSRHRMIPGDAAQLANNLTNVAFWPVVPPSNDASHRSAILSMAVLALSFKPVGRLLVAEVIRKYHAPDGLDLKPHAMNVLRGWPSALAYIPSFLYGRYVAPMRLPGFFLRNPQRFYGLSYHAEHLPHYDSRVWLSDETNAVGLPKLNIDLKFHRSDAEGLLRGHELVGAWLQDNGLGKLSYRQPFEETADAILNTAAHGTHHIGTARMGTDRRTAVVDSDLRCFDSPNLYVASSAVFPTSGQANPTLTAVALGVRLANHLAPHNDRV